MSTLHPLSAKVGTNFADKRWAFGRIFHSLTKATKLFLHIYVYIYIYMYVCVCVCVCVCVYMYVCICMFPHGGFFRFFLTSID
jgi:hypothetical protein